MTLQDQYGRTMQTLRVSVTDRCDLRCQYCMPARGAVFAPKPELLSTAELHRALDIFSSLGITRFKFTGGEPLLRTDLEELIQSNAHRAEIGLTTNGTLLAGRAEGLRKAGLRRITVSMDTLHPGNYASITRGGDLRRVKDGLRAVAELGFQPVKVNAVLLNQSPEELLQLAALSIASDWEIRFIEYMPVSAGLEGALAPKTSPASLMLALRTAFGDMEDLGRERGSAPATRLRIKGARGTLGMIRSVSEPFCGACDRLRLQADGFMRLCMARPGGLQVKALLRGGGTDLEIAEAIRKAAWLKPAGHEFYRAAAAPGAQMSTIGG
jgi:cyclic pyranopterin phosphate synthase